MADTKTEQVKLAKPNSMPFRSHYVQKRRKKRKKENEI